MSHYEERLEQDISLIRGKTAEMAKRAEGSIKKAVRALLAGNANLSYEIIISDNIINRDNEDIAKKCYAFIARHLPSAGHLRWVASVLHLTVFLERIGDQAVAISKVAVQLSSPLDPKIARYVERLEEESTLMLRQATNAFLEDNIELAKSTKLLDRQVNQIFQDAHEEISDENNKDSWMIKDLLGLHSVFYSLERVSDLAKNICEKTEFSVAGQMKFRKPVKVLFLAESNNSLVQMAEAIGNKSFSDCGSFASAGKLNENEDDAQFQSFMHEKGLDLQVKKYNTIEMLPPLDEFSVLISLDGKVSSYISVIPFDVVCFDWEVGPSLDQVAEEAKQEQLKETYQQIVENIHRLLEIMRGEEAVCSES